MEVNALVSFMVAQKKFNHKIDNPYVCGTYHIQVFFCKVVLGKYKVDIHFFGINDITNPK